MIALFRRDVHGSLDDYLQGIEKAHGAEAAESVRIEMQAMTERHTDDFRLDWQQAQRDASQIYGPIGFLLAIPEADFLTAIEAGVGLVRDPMRVAALPNEINRVCEGRGLPYRMTGVSRQVQFEWTGDATIAEQVVTPALSALDDPRFAKGARVELNGAREQLRRNTPESRKRAVGEACSAVESAMKILLDQHGKVVPQPPNLSNLIRCLVEEKLVERDFKEMLEGPGFFGNRKGRHGAGAVAHAVTVPEAEGVVAGAAVAITYLAHQLPPLA